MCVRQHRNPIFCLIPPYMLDQIARNGDKAQREVALRTRAKDSTFRSLRMVAVPAKGAAHMACPWAPKTAFDLQRRGRR